MRHLQILADPLEVWGQIQVIHPMGVNNPDLYREMDDELVEQIAFPFLT